MMDDPIDVGSSTHFRKSARFSAGRAKADVPAARRSEHSTTRSSTTASSARFSTLRGPRAHVTVRARGSDPHLRALARHADLCRSGFWETTRFVRQQRTGLDVPRRSGAGGGGVVTGVGRRALRLRRSSTSEEAPRARQCAPRASARAFLFPNLACGWVPGEGPRSQNVAAQS